MRPTQAAELLSQRVPTVRWDVEAVREVMEDFPGLPHFEVVTALAEWSKGKTMLKDGPRTLRRFYEKWAKDHPETQARTSDTFACPLCASTHSFAEYVHRRRWWGYCDTCQERLDALDSEGHSYEEALDIRRNELHGND